MTKYVKTFSLPRLAGTEGEKKAVKLTHTTFKKIGFKNNQITKKSFDFSDFYSTTLIKLLMTLNLTFNLNLVLFIYIHVYLTIFLIISIVIIVYLIMRGLKHPEIPGFWGEYFGETNNSTNVFTKVPAKKIPENKAGNIIISAHLDSKSQSINTLRRVRLYKLLLYSEFALIGIYILYLINF